MPISIVTPALNQLAYLRQCVANVAAQAAVDVHLVSDGGSTDGTLAFLEEAAPSSAGRLRFRAGPDRGMYDALNRGFAATEGQRCGYLNCDDLLLPWATALVDAIFDAHPEVDVVYGDALEQRGGRWAVVVNPPSTLLDATFRGGGHLAQPAVFFRRQLLDRLGGFDATLQLLGDHDLWLRAHRAGARFLKVWEFLAVQRMVPGQLMEHQDLAEEERTLILERQYGSAPSRAQRLSGRALYAAFHRAGIGALAGGALLDRVGAAPDELPWARTIRSGFLRHPRALALLRALAGPSRSVRYLELTAAGRAALFPAPDAAGGQP